MYTHGLSTLVRTRIIKASRPSSKKGYCQRKNNLHARAQTKKIFLEDFTRTRLKMLTLGNAMRLLHQ